MSLLTCSSRWRVLVLVIRFLEIHAYLYHSRVPVIVHKSGTPGLELPHVLHGVTVFESHL